MSVPEPPDVPGTKPPPSPEGPNPRVELRRLTRRGLALGGLATLGTLAGLRWLQTAAEDGGLAWPLRRVLALNARLSEALFSEHRRAPTFQEVDTLRPNGMYGLEGEAFDQDSWLLHVQGLATGKLDLGLAALQKLPVTEQTFEFKCIEGWSTVCQWKGVRFVDFCRVHPPPTRSGHPFDPGRPDDLPPYVSLSTPHAEYYVGLDTPSALHPQTLLAWELNGEPLTEEHGAPLRLVIPVKYGIKNLKRIGTIAWTTVRPADYWAERGYDWFAGL